MESKHTQDLRAMEHDLQVDLIPGTEVMTDVGGLHFIHSARRSHQVLVPQPSSAKDDPLNWSPTWKACAIFSSLFSTFSMGFGPLALGPMFPLFIKDFDRSLADVVQFVGVCILVLGFSNLFWVTLSSLYGRRFVLIASTFVCLLTNIWRAEAKSYSSFLGACALNGFGAGPSETMGPVIIADIFFLHDRGTYNALYFATYFGSLVVGATVAGPMADHLGWRVFFWLNVGILGLSTIMLLFLFPETKWHRRNSLPSGSPIGPTSSTDDKPRTEAKDEMVEGSIHSDSSPNEAGLEESIVGKGSPSKSQFYLLQPKDQHTTLLNELWMPWRLFGYPIVQFSSFVVSWSASLFLTVNLTQAQNFAAPPYNYSSQTIAAFNVAVLVGALIGLVTAGPLSDWIAQKLTARNHGIREPEMRLLTLIPYTLIMIISNVVIALGYQRSWSWKIIVLVGYTFAGIQVAALPAIASTYAVDSYKPVAGTIFITVTINKNLWGYGFSKFITPWIIETGYIPPILTNMALTTTWCLFGVLFWYKGKWFRTLTKDSSIHRLDE